MNEFHTLGILALAILTVGGLGFFFFTRFFSDQGRDALTILKATVEGSNLGTWDWWIDTNKVHFDERWCEMLGLDYKHTMMDFTTWETRVHPDDIAYCKEQISLHLAGKKNFYEVKHRLRHASGDWVWILARGKIIQYDKKGTPLRFSGTHLDITHMIQIEEQYQVIQELAQIGYWELDLQTKQTTWSQQIYHIYQVPVDTPTDLAQGLAGYVEEDQVRLKEFLDEVAKGGTFKDTFRFKSAEGKQKWVEVKASPARDAFGVIRKIKGSIQDISLYYHTYNNLVLQKDKLARSEARLTSIMENSMAAFYECDDIYAKKITFMSDQCVKIFEYTPNDFVSGKIKFSEFILSEDFAEVQSQFLDAVQNKTPFEIQYRVKLPSGRIRYVLERGNITPGGMLSGILFDITQLKNAENELQEERHKMAQASKLAAVGEVSAGIAHEINNPLAIIAGNLELMAGKMTDEKMQKRVATSQRAVERIVKIINGLRKYTHRNDTVEKSSVSLKNLFEEVHTLIFPKLHRHQVNVVYPQDIDGYVWVNEIEIGQVFVNLFNNAIDAIKDFENSQDRWVKLEIESKDHDIYFRVVDSGTGIPREHIEKLFNPFFTTKMVGEGTGLGLPIVKGILESFRGDVYYELYQGHTSFVVRLPRHNVIAQDNAA